MSLASLMEDRARAESKARRSEEQLALALDAAQLGRWEFDIAQQRLEWSDITRRMYGCRSMYPSAPRRTRHSSIPTIAT
jgi:PAS domain-containing protein